MESHYYVGTSGWTYLHWKGVFYPIGIPQKKWFEFYSRFFNTVEINATFYRTPPLKTFQGWEKKAPQGFLFAVKMSQLLTHKKKLTSPTSLLKTLLERYRAIGRALGPILIQLPPSMHLDLIRLHEFISLLPKDLMFGIEFRHKSWFCERTFELLDSYGIGFVSFHHPYIDCPKIVTGKLVYIRFHGTESLYRGRYTKEQLDVWAKFIKENTSPNRPCFAYFNNDFEGNAIFDAINLKRLLGEKIETFSLPG